jgi:hypothetical protein
VCVCVCAHTECLAECDKRDVYVCVTRCVGAHCVDTRCGLDVCGYVWLSVRVRPLCRCVL